MKRAFLLCTFWPATRMYFGANLKIYELIGPTMIMTTTNTLEDKKVIKYLGVVTGEAILGANIFKDIFAGIRDIVGGRSNSYEKALQDARHMAFSEMEEKARRVGANAIIGIDIDYETIGASGSMLMVSVSGTAISVE